LKPPLRRPEDSEMRGSGTRIRRRAVETPLRRPEDDGPTATAPLCRLPSLGRTGRPRLPRPSGPGRASEPPGRLPERVGGGGGGCEGRRGIEMARGGYVGVCVGLAATSGGVTVARSRERPGRESAGGGPARPVARSWEQERARRRLRGCRCSRGAMGALSSESESGPVTVAPRSESPPTLRVPV
jgi:hypothetical protein